MSSELAKHPETKPQWWKEATFYQIYPASFKDSNNDGWGDINGIRSKLSYLKSLGITAVWISPFYDSPQKDMGYDIRDYDKVWPTYGTNDEIFQLINEAHKLDIKIVVDLVINHCSDEHKWFEESRASLDNPKRDWFYWRKPKGYTKEGKPIAPNNWRSCFGGSAWQYDERTKEFYLHLFAVGQPDLNWENPVCRAAVFEDSMGFWLRNGVDGFRIDTAFLYSKDTTFPDAPVTNPKDDFQDPGNLVSNGPRIHEFHKLMNHFMLSQIDDKRTIMTVGEVGHAGNDARLSYTSAKSHELSEIFTFKHTDIGTSEKFRYNLAPFTLKDWKLAVADSFRWINGTDSWSTIYFENHDQARSVSRFTDDSPESRVPAAKMLASLQICMTGTMYVYQGQELGCINLKNTPLKDYEDVEVRTNYKVISEKFGKDSQEVKEFAKAVAVMSRDHARTPYPWSSKDQMLDLMTLPSHGLRSTRHIKTVLMRRMKRKIQNLFLISGERLLKLERKIRIFWFMVTTLSSMSLTITKSLLSPRSMMIRSFLLFSISLKKMFPSSSQIPRNTLCSSVRMIMPMALSQP